MLKNHIKYIVALFLLISIGCAKRGSITGGLKDTLAPVMKMSSPKNFNTNFKGRAIKLVFDENIKLQNINKQLVISPPMKYEPIISPQTASKFINIKIIDTLQENTTYSFNFGQSIADNNEGNPYNQFKYVFSTGNYIDSLALGGRIKDALEKEAEPFISVMLYDVNDSFKDSIIYTNPPRYITNTLDSLKTFRLENLKPGKYLLVALKDKNNNNKFNPKEEKIGFIKEYITIPNDTVFELELFQEINPFKSFKPTQVSGNRLFLGYEGEMAVAKHKPEITLKNKVEILPSIVTRLPKKDSLQIWYKPIKTDSLAVTVNKDKYTANYLLKIKNQKKDSLTFNAITTGILNFRDRFTIESSIPLTNLDNSKIKLINKDSTAVAFTTEYDTFNQKLFIDFKTVPVEKYTFTILPGALTDFYGNTNDTLSYNTQTKELEDYGNLKVKLENVKQFPVIVELTDAKGDVVASEYTESNPIVNFNLLNPAIYSLRIIYDENKNKTYDPGNYLEKRYSEQVVYFSKEIDVRSNWDIEQTFDVSLPYTPEPKKKIEPKDKKKSIKL
jgi:uncharacterized protein (DUF2141 family)